MPRIPAGLLAALLVLPLAACGAGGPKAFSHRDPQTGYELSGEGNRLHVSGPASPEEAMAIAKAHCARNFLGRKERDEIWATLDPPKKEYTFLCGGPNH